jgi:hypothetical protein
VEYRSISGDGARLDRAATVALGRQARRLLVKSGDRIRRLAGALGDAEVAAALLHPDGFLNVPVLVLGELLVRGFTDELYRDVCPEGGFASHPLPERAPDSSSSP